MHLGKQFWRIGRSQNLRDHSGQVPFYFEKSFVPKLSGFVSVTTNTGGVKSDFGALMDSSLTLGLKWFVL